MHDAMSCARGLFVQSSRRSCLTDDYHRLDDVEDNSPLRRSRPSTHSVFGMAQTINAATYRIVEVVRGSLATRNPNVLNIVIGSYSIYKIID